MNNVKHHTTIQLEAVATQNFTLPVTVEITLHVILAKIKIP